LKTVWDNASIRSEPRSSAAKCRACERAIDLFRIGQHCLDCAPTPAPAAGAKSHASRARPRTGSSGAARSGSGTAAAPTAAAAAAANTARPADS
jgi:hypothetical protein